MPQLSPAPVMTLGHQTSKASIAASDTTYHSLYTVDLYEPGSPSSKRQTPAPLNAATTPPRRPILETAEEHVSVAAPVTQKVEMRRQDSGYESLPRRTSESSRRRASGSSISTTTPSTSAAPAPRQRTRPSMKRAKKSARASTSSVYLTRTSTQPQNLLPYLAAQAQQAAGGSFFHFPTPGPDHLHRPGHETATGMVPFQPSASPDPFGVNPPQNPHLSSTHALALNTTRSQEQQHHDDPDLERAHAPSPRPSPPPQTTHYWTSDRTRRLEYAAIDAASRGVRGWILRHIVPDCIIPHEKRRLGFEDDRGSVRRYRLQLEDEKDAPGADFGESGEEGKRVEGLRSWVQLRLWSHGKEVKAH